MASLIFRLTYVKRDGVPPSLFLNRRDARTGGGSSDGVESASGQRDVDGCGDLNWTDRVTGCRGFFRVSISRRAPQVELIWPRYLGPVEEIPGLVNCHVCGRSGPGVDGLIALPNDLEAEALRSGWR